MEAGEAHFAVAPDAARPFIVSAGDVSVRAVGTAFNVRYAPGGAVEVIVAEGKVRVGQGGPHSSAAATASLVSAGERLVMPRKVPAPVVEKISPDALRETLGWQSRLADFADAPLADVVARFNARSRVQLVIEDEVLAQRRIGGTFALDEAEAFVRLLERDGEIVGERHGETEIRLRRTR
jgi:transmembrane sensor